MSKNYVVTQSKTRRGVHAEKKLVKRLNFGQLDKNLVLASLYKKFQPHLILKCFSGGTCGNLEGNYNGEHVTIICKIILIIFFFKPVKLTTFKTSNFHNFV
jgi:hypothetical protein